MVREMIIPKHSYELALNIIGQYYKATRDIGLVIYHWTEPNIDSYPDADFSGMYVHGKATDPSCLKIRNVYAISISNLPVLWKSKLQNEIDILTMEADILANRS